MKFTTLLTLTLASLVIAGRIPHRAQADDEDYDWSNDNDDCDDDDDYDGEDSDDYQPPSKSTTQCPVNGTLSTGWSIAPSLMVPVNKEEPNKKYGSTDSPIVTPSEICTIFNLELDQRAVNKTCNLMFDFPNHDQTDSHYFFSGDGHFTFTGYAVGVGATEDTTYAHQPEAGPSPPTPPGVITPGKAYLINSAPCGVPEGAGDVTVSGMLCSDDTELKFQQSGVDEVCPLGFFVVLTD